MTLYFWLGESGEPVQHSSEYLEAMRGLDFVQGHVSERDYCILQGVSELLAKQEHALLQVRLAIGEFRE
jgi:hypothetical protein